ncbi:hypothetical protein SNE35_24100 [Paucibacter sp. R3-3]|uniref:Uncharacterized protein n=1 Tax=Roseateles agri TaxID=3098619 RepID=A0ABU5DMS2_9BURK|nr:hypothetical protein [Paucibacter sp. R3-3]
MTGKTLGISTIAWLTITQLAASGMGGYLAGRLRHRWASVHADEVYFRDTAHGFLAWSVATLVTASMLTAAVGSIVSGGAKAGGAIIGGTSVGAMAAAPTAASSASAAGTSDNYFVDSLFRSTGSPQGSAATGAPAGGPAPTDEVARIFAHAAGSDALGADDTRYVGQLVSERTGLNQQDAEKRVTDAYARMQAKAAEAKATADKARKAAAAASLWGFIALLVGAFIASVLGVVGGRHRDRF